MLCFYLFTRKQIIMMDFNSFSDVNFDSKEWINQTLKTVDSNINQDASVTSLMAKLQMYYHQTNNELEGTSQNVMNNLPRVLHEIELLSVETLELKEKMSSVKEEISNVEKNAGASISSLEKINNIKVQLTEAKEALYEADNWTVLSADIEAVFETSEIDLIASKLVSMQQSLNVLSNASDYEYKRNHLESLKNRLEALASPNVVDSFTSKSIDKSKNLVKIFEDMGRFQLLVKYYCDCQKSTLIYQWQAMVNFDSDENVVASFQNFYDLLLTNWQEQIKWCEQVMPKVSPTAVLVELYTDLLISVSQNFSKIFEDNMKRMEEPLMWLLQIKKATKNFALNIKAKIGPQNIGHSATLNLSKAIYLPFIQPFSKYYSFQKSAFNQCLLGLTKNVEILDFIQTISQNNTSLFSISDKYLKLCVELSESCCLPAFLTAFEWLLTSYLNTFKNTLKAITDGNHTDFATFQMFVTVLQHLGEIIVAVKQIDQECIEIILLNSKALKKADSDPFVAYPNLLLNNDKQKELSTLSLLVVDSTESSVMKSNIEAIEIVCRDVYKASFNILLFPIINLLKSVRNDPGLKQIPLSSELPDYSFSPQEYITQIGQYLINLPQMLEPFLLLDKSSLNLALSSISEYAVLLTGDEDGSGFVDILLGCIAKSTCQAYYDVILNIPSVSSSSCKQLITDINYLGNVLEDFGFSLTDTLKNVVLLMKLSPAEYSSHPPSCSPQLVAAIRQMRNIIPE